MPAFTFKRSLRREGYALIAPLTLFLLVLLGFPLVVDIVYSVSRVGFENIRAPEFMGLGNYAKAIADREFWSAAWFSLRFGLLVSAIEVCVGLALAIFLAPLLERRPWLMAFLMLPMMVAPALVGLMYRLILHEFVGVAPYYLELWFGDSPAFFSNDNAFKTLVVVESLQWTPFALLILHTAYSAISLDVREAAALDGAGAWRRLAYVDLPMMAPTIAVTFFIRFIDSFRVFDNVYTLVGAGAGGATTSISIYIYQAFFKVGDIGLAVAASMLLLGGSFVVLLVLNWAGSRRAAA
jgi:multiple sugar transport system permease protein